MRTDQDVELAFDEATTPERRAQVREALEAMNPLVAGRVPVTVRELPGGAANANFVVDLGERKLVLRIADPNGARFGIDRACGFEAHRVAADLDIAPPLVAALAPAGHCLTAYVAGQTMTAQDMHDDDALQQVGHLLARLHGTDVAIRRWSVFDAVRSYFVTAEREALTLAPETPRLIQAVNDIDQVFASLPEGEVLCHNDLVPQNLLRVDDGVKLVDWEYGGMGRRHFDLGNFAANAALSAEQVDTLLHAYRGHEPTDADRARVDLMGVMASLREYTWAVIADPILDYDIEHHDITYLEWGDRYLRRALDSIDAPDFARKLDVAAGR